MVGLSISKDLLLANKSYWRLCVRLTSLAAD